MVEEHREVDLLSSAVAQLADGLAVLLVVPRFASENA